MHARHPCLWMRGFSSKSRTGWSWKREKAHRPVVRTRRLFRSASWPSTACNPPKCRQYSAGSSIWLQRAQSRGNLPISVTVAQTMTDCEFWRLVTILPSVNDDEAQTRSFCWITTCWMSNFFSSVNTRFGIVPSASPGGFRCIFGARGHMIGRKLQAMQHLEELHPSRSFLNRWWNGRFAHTGCGGQGSATSAKVSSQLFPCVFEKLREADTPFSFAVWSVKGVSTLLELPHDLPHRWKVYIQPFCNFNITFFVFVKLNHCISVCSHCKTNFRKFWYT